VSNIVRCEEELRDKRPASAWFEILSGLGRAISRARHGGAGFPAPCFAARSAWMSYVLVFLGGGLRGGLRHFVNVLFAKMFGTAFPFHTLFETVTGSLVRVALAVYCAFAGEASQELRLFLTTGILGGYTTFSAFSLDAVLLYERGEVVQAALYVAGAVALAIGGLVAGLALVRHFS